MRGSVPLGTTPTGIEWAMKAMHPAGEGTPHGIPDGFPRPTAKWMITCTKQFVPPTGGAPATTWDLDLICYNHPLIFGYAHGAWGAADSQTTVWNPAVWGGEEPDLTSYPVGMKNFINMAERYRPMYASVTATPVCSALTNQGTVTVAQYPMMPRVISYDFDQAPEVGYKDKARRPEAAPSATTTEPIVPVNSRNPAFAAAAAKAYKAAPANVTPVRLRSLIEAWPEYYADLSALTILPNTYVGQFKDGAYSVLKFSGNYNEWRSSRQVYQHCGLSGSMHMYLDPTTLDLIPQPTTTFGFPYPNLLQTSLAEDGSPVIQRCEDNVMHLSFRGMDPASTVKITFRYAFECEVLPQSTIAPFVSSPAEPDHAAMYAYSLITRRMKDGYPEAYNSWEKLVNVIKLASKAAGVVIPGAGLIGEAAGWLYDTFATKKGSNRTPEEKEEAIRAKTKKAALAIQRPAAGFSKQQMDQLHALASSSKKPQKQGKRKK